MQNEKNDTAGRELRISRLLDAPVELVWEVWTDPGHIKNWWGPDGFTNTITKMELQPEGEWDLIMHGPDGTDYKNKSVFKEVVKHKKLVYEHISGPRFLATITFESRGNKTFIEWHMLFETKEVFIQTVKTFKADEGLKQNVERLNRYLQQKTDDPISITQELNAPVNKVWSAITSRAEMIQWYFEMIPAFEPIVGFETSFNVHTPDNKDYLHLWKVTEVIPQRRIVYNWKYKGSPGSSFVVWELTASDNKTILEFSHHGQSSFPKDNPDFARESCVKGWEYFISQRLKKFLEN
ncbi:hypothetical protein A8C56_05305 [Niabella ginsenosidivorans]|uniref:Activator of Hsp90 ATPase homologue 1/2-like C-terminal domain-containing protein n=1 Tax=Niabella ginsenosidivorans TaxID=1176587 RepID=A0A1A9HZH5_9BACT|nr:SRPBCC family protein [Niabella ginsenosidivorans]ANH80485.1 hypothetical protein A8C56_05305 [Niabella ginsenosidivorans]